MKKKSLFAGFLALVMSVSMMSFTAFATESTEPVADATIARTNGSTKYCGWLLGDAERATDANQYDVTGNYCEITTSLPIVGN